MINKMPPPTHGPHIFKRLAMLIMGLVIVTPLISVIPGGERVINLLPFIGNVETGNIDYREKLLENSITVIKIGRAHV